MSKLFWRALKAVPAVVAGSLVATSATLAESLPASEANNVDTTLEQINYYQNTGDNPSMSQVTNVNQLRDVSPADWAYEALRSLVDRYGCIVGYPNQTYRGNRALSRYEFAAGLNSCLNQIERLIASSEAVLREDIDTLNRLIQEFEAELATIAGRVDNLESRTAFLEDHQFSTTTKLNGEVIFAIADTFGDVPQRDDAGNLIGEDDPTEVTFSDRVRLNFDASFYGSDRLRVRFEAGNVPRFDEATGFNATRLGFDASNGNDVEFTDIHYRFAVGENFRGYVAASGLDIDEVFEVNNPILESSGTGALSRFSRRNPLVFRGPEGTGAAFNYKIGERFTVSGLYLAETEEASNPDNPITDRPTAGDKRENNGLFNGSFSTGAQVKFEATESIELALTYIYAYQDGRLNDDGEAEEIDLGGSTSGGLASNFTEISILAVGEDNADLVDYRSHKLGLGGSFEFSERFVLSAWGGLAFASAADPDIAGTDLEIDATLFTVGANFSILDLGKEGAVFSIAGGIPPKVTDSDIEVNGVDEDPTSEFEDDDTTFLLEALYKFPVNDNILITPGAYVVFNPAHDNDNDTVFVGVIRTTFKF